MSSTVVLKAAGLVTSPNQLDIPDGSLSVADDVIIKRDGVIESRRGFKLYGNEMGNATDRAKQLSVYRDRIIRHYSNILQYDSDGKGNFVDFAGNYEEAEEGIRMKSVESNGNYYFTTSEGIKKLSSTNAEGLATASVQNAGGVKAVDLTSRVNITQNFQTGFLPQDSAVAYRVVWNRRDVNNNLIQGTPSQRSVVYNPMINLLIRDFHQILLALDNCSDGTGLLSDGDYMNNLKLDSTSGALELYTNLTELVNKIDNAIVYGDDGTSAPIDLVGGVSPNGTVEVSGNVATITRNTGSGVGFDEYLQAGSEIEIEGLVAPNDVLNGTHTLSLVSTDTIQFNITTPDFGPSATDSTVILKSNEYRSLSQPTSPGLPATNAELVALQNYIDSIILRLQVEPPTTTLNGIVISTTNQTNFIQPLDITTSATVKLNITIPEDITTDYFIQIYRSSISQALDTANIDELTPSDELKLIFEQFMTTEDINNSFIEIEDNTPDEFRGANLYTNPSTGEGILQSNDIPPFAKDINRFRNVVFYGNTRTRNALQLSLLGVEKMIKDYNSGIIPKISISNGTNTETYSFILGQQQITDLTCYESTAGSLNGLYFDIDSANSNNRYRFYYKTTTGTDELPNLENEEDTGITEDGRRLIRIDIPDTATASDVAIKTKDTLNTIPQDFSVEDNTLPVIRITTVGEGIVNVNDTGDAFDLGTLPVSPGFSFDDSIQAGTGEDPSTNTVLISSTISPAQAVDATARSLVRVINKNDDESIYAYYVSGENQVPGIMQFESKTLTGDRFTVIANNSNTGLSFSPDISPQYNIDNIVLDVVTNFPTITTNTDHNFSDGDNVYITLSDTVPSIDGLHQVEVISPTEFRIQKQVTTVNTSNIGNVNVETFSQNSENEEKSNRVYYSKFQQPEAVPIFNYFDVGAADKPILRIFPLRDSLFVFKTDGVYRISGETAPFNVQLFDSSTKLIADDTVSVVDNVLYCWSEQGIAVISESNASIISRNIDDKILQLGSANFTNFRKATWGIGYESDNSYIVYTTASPEDTTATIGFRFGTLTNSWTNINKNTTCGVVNDNDDTLYMGTGDVNQIEVERKNFDRTDYADRQYELLIPNDSYSQAKITLSDVSNIEIGDVITQEQLLTTYTFNRLLDQLDRDSGLNLSLKNGDPDGYASLYAVAGDNLRSKILDLANRLDSDGGLSTSDYFDTIANQSLVISDISVGFPTTITTTANHNLFTGRYVNISGSDSNPKINGVYQITETASPNKLTIDVNVVGTGSSGVMLNEVQSFEDILVCYNKIIEKLNADPNLVFNTYRQVSITTLQEAIVTNVNPITKVVTLNLDLDFVRGPITLYKAIKTSIIYSPNTMGDPLGYKHLREATLMFEAKSFTSAEMTFSTDLIPSTKVVPFDLDGNGIFGHDAFGNGFFGGASHAAPFRTSIPRDAQRCTFIRVGFKHKIAREKFNIFGVTITGEVGLSTRAYR